MQSPRSFNQGRVNDSTSHNAPVWRLPVELLVHIFGYCDSDIRARLHLAHTCQHWSNIASATPTLWTQVEVSLTRSADRRLIDAFLSLVEIQLARAGGLLLDVNWRLDTDAQFEGEITRFLHRKAPFCQWRSLTIGLLKWPGLGSSDNATMERDKFTNLETLRIQTIPTIFILRSIVQASTPALNMLDLNASWRPIRNLEQTYVEILSRVSSLVLPNIYDPDVELCLPPNIHSLQANFRYTHGFPCIERYKLLRCIFKLNRTVDLGRLTSLIITGPLEVHVSCHVYLPSLRDVELQSILMHPWAYIEAPGIESLHVSNDRHNTQTATSRVRDMVSAFRQAGYVLFPSKSLNLEISLPPESILAFLGRAAQVERVLLSFNGRGYLRETMERLLYEWKEVTEVVGVKDNPRICPHLHTLRLVLRWPRESQDPWDASGLSALKSFRAGYSGPRVYVSWKHEDGGFSRLL